MTYQSALTMHPEIQRHIVTLWQLVRELPESELEQVTTWLDSHYQWKTLLAHPYVGGQVADMEATKGPERDTERDQY